MLPRLAVWEGAHRGAISWRLGHRVCSSRVSFAPLRDLKKHHLGRQFTVSDICHAYLAGGIYRLPSNRPRTRFPRSWLIHSSRRVLCYNLVATCWNSSQSGRDGAKIKGGRGPETQVTFCWASVYEGHSDESELVIQRSVGPEFRFWRNVWHCLRNQTAISVPFLHACVVPSSSSPSSPHSAHRRRAQLTLVTAYPTTLAPHCSARHTPYLM